MGAGRCVDCGRPLGASDRDRQPEPGFDGDPSRRSECAIALHDALKTASDALYAAEDAWVTLYERWRNRAQTTDLLPLADELSHHAEAVRDAATAVRQVAERTVTR